MNKLACVFVFYSYKILFKYNCCCFLYAALFRLNIKSDVKPSTSIQEESCFIFAQSGELFVKVTLGDQLNEDSDTGFIFFRLCVLYWLYLCHIGQLLFVISTVDCG